MKLALGTRIPIIVDGLTAAGHLSAACLSSSLGTSAALIWSSEERARHTALLYRETFELICVFACYCIGSVDSNARFWVIHRPGVPSFYRAAFAILRRGSWHHDTTCMQRVRRLRAPCIKTRCRSTICSYATFGTNSACILPMQRIASLGAKLFGRYKSMRAEVVQRVKDFFYPNALQRH